MPTWSTSSPTTTRAVKEKRRPPLTTFATRLISTTRSCSSWPPGPRGRSRCLPWEAMRGQVTVAIAWGRDPSKGQPGLAGAVGQGLHAAVVAVAAAVEDTALHAGRLGALGKQLAGVESCVFDRGGYRYH